MIQSKALRVSIVIPVYNEADNIAACLAAIERQSTAPFEVIVIDNNSTDGTAVIAQRFPFVRMLHETRQGVVYARDAGFNAARGEIIGRIDADTVLNDDWVACVQRVFLDASMAMVSGKVEYHDIAARRTVNFVDLWIRRWMAYLLGSDVAVQGANMALRRSIWLDIKANVCHQAGLHEDFDLAIHATAAGHQVAFTEAITASIGYRQASYNFRAFCDYALTSPRTYALHGVKSGRYMYQIVALVVALYVPINLLQTGYDRQLQRFSWRVALTTKAPMRVNPATFVD